MTIAAEAFRTGMRRLASSVCLITSIGTDGQRTGLTATAVTSVSAEPPSLLVCVNRLSSSNSVIAATGVFAVNVLAEQDRGLSERFSGKFPLEERFGLGVWMQLVTGAPVLNSALVSFDCRLSQRLEMGSHVILFGTIEALHLGRDHADSEVSTLLYAHGKYGRFSPLESLLESSLDAPLDAPLDAAPDP